MKIVTVEEIKARLDAGETINLVDVREPHEHEEYNIGGILLPLGNIKSLDISNIEILKEKEVILYCRSGNRSGQAALILESEGFKNVWNLSGGMIKWRENF